jgi:hypothetical protein
MKTCLPTNPLEAHLWCHVVQSDAEAQPVFRSYRSSTHVLAISDLQLDNTVVLDSRVTLGGSPEVEVTLV